MAKHLFLDHQFAIAKKLVSIFQIKAKTSNYRQMLLLSLVPRIYMMVDIQLNVNTTVEYEPRVYCFRLSSFET